MSVLLPDFLPQYHSFLIFIFVGCTKCYTFVAFLLLLENSEYIIHSINKALNKQIFSCYFCQQLILFTQNTSQKLQTPKKQETQEKKLSPGVIKQRKGLYVYVMLRKITFFKKK